MSEGRLYLYKLIIDKNIHFCANAHAIPECRALETVKLIDAYSSGKTTEEEAKNILKKEYYYQEHPDEYPGFGWGLYE